MEDTEEQDYWQQYYGIKIYEPQQGFFMKNYKGVENGQENVDLYDGDNADIRL